MEYLQKCITPRVKTPEDIAFDESKEYYKNYGRVWSDDDLQQFRVKYESRYPPRQIRMDRDDFIFSHCIACCTRRVVLGGFEMSLRLRLHRIKNKKNMQETVHL